MLVFSCASKPQPKPDKEVAEKSLMQLEKDISGTESQAFGTIEQVLNDPDRSLDNSIVLDQKGWVSVSEKRVFDSSVSLDEAREILLKSLRNKAIKKKVGTEVEIVSHLSDVMIGGDQEVFEESVWSGFFRSTVSGMITEEEFKDKIAISSDGLLVDMTLDAFVEPVEGDRDPSFYLDANLKSNKLKNGEELNITLTSSKDSYVYIINLMSDNNAMLIYPNKYMKDNFINANTELTIPNESLRNKIKLRVGLLPDQKFSSESIYIICTKDKVPLLHNFPKVGTDLKIISNSSQSFFELQKWLVKIQLNRRVEKALVYSVSK